MSVVNQPRLSAVLRAEMDADSVLGYALTSRFLPVIVDRLQATRLRLADLYGRGHDHWVG